MAGAFFGTDGIRDLAGQGRLAPEAVKRIGWALGQVVRRHQAGHAPRVLTARDPRPSGPDLLSGLAAGLAVHGAVVEDAGVLPTPALAWATAKGGYDLGIMLSASHNPPGYNGIKLFLSGGRKATAAEEQEVEAAIAAAPTLWGAIEARTERAATWATRYVEATAAWLRTEGDLVGDRLVVDLAAGAATTTAEPLLQALGALAVPLHAAGSRPINAQCGTEHPEAWLEAVRTRPGWMGLAVDGDGDRVLLADETGELLDGDDLLAILARDAVAFQGQVPGGCVVGTVMSNLGLEDLLRRHDVRLERSAVGDRHVADLMRHFDAAFGGEPSGHIVLARDDLGTPAPLIGDALVAGIRVLQAAHRLGRPLSALRKERVRHPQRLVNVPMVTRIPLERWPAFQQALAAERARCGDAARFVIRYSGTEPLLRIMVEGRDAALVDGAVEALADVARAATAPTP